MPLRSDGGAAPEAPQARSEARSTGMAAARRTSIKPLPTSPPKTPTAKAAVIQTG